MEDHFSLNWLRNSPHIRCLKTRFGQVELEYYVFGRNPRLFISSGMHGDEYRIISSVSKAIKLNLKHLPSFLFIPIASPIAVKNKTRKNAMNQDVNRGFLEGSRTDEAQAMMEIVQSHTFDLSISFHQDLEIPAFYMYDNLTKDKNKDISGNFAQLKWKLSRMGVGLFNGIDDPNDPMLRYAFEDGYRALQQENITVDDGQLESWMIRRGISSRVFTPEIPEKNTTQETKDALVEAFFTDLILPFF